MASRGQPLTRRLVFEPEWRITLFAAVMVPLLVGLGFWQLARADEKRALAAAYEAQRQRPPARLAELVGAPAAELAYRPVRLQGSYRQGEYFLVDNRLRQGRFGNEVVAVFDSLEGDTVLVNRGWLAADPARRQAPEVPEVLGQVTVTGHVYVAPGEPYLLEQQALAAGWPKTVQALEMGTLATAVATPAGRLFPHPVRLDDAQPGALVTDWQVINVAPQKHTAYAVQWFAMAAVLALLYLLRSSNLAQLLRAAVRS